MTISQESADKETMDSEMHTLDVQVGVWVVVVIDINEYPGEETYISDINGVKVMLRTEVEVVGNGHSQRT